MAPEGRMCVQGTEGRGSRWPEDEGEERSIRNGASVSGFNILANGGGSEGRRTRSRCAPWERVTRNEDVVVLEHGGT